MSWTFILPIILLTVPVLLLLGAHVARSDWRRRRTPPELRGDWWARFERDFRTYAARVTDGAGESTRPPHREGHPPPATRSDN